jgi:hypothetical protein
MGRPSGRQFDNEELHSHSVPALFGNGEKGKFLIPAALPIDGKSKEQSLAEVGIPLLLCQQIVAKCRQENLKKFSTISPRGNRPNCSFRTLRPNRQLIFAPWL